MSKETPSIVDEPVSRIYNVALTVVDLVRAESADEAITKLAKALVDSGFTVYEESPGNAFESEELGFEPDPAAI